MEAAKDPDDTDLARLVGELSVQDPGFRGWWAEHRVNSASYGTKHYRHPLVGDLTLDCDICDSPDDSGQRLMILTAEPGTPPTTLCASLPPGPQSARPRKMTPRRRPHHRHRTARVHVLASARQIDPFRAAQLQPAQADCDRLAVAGTLALGVCGGRRIASRASASAVSR